MRPRCVPLIVSKAQKVSRQQLLAWLNETLDSNYAKIEELFTGVAYCRLIKMLYPNFINLNRIKSHGALERDYLHNYKLLQNTFNKLRIYIQMPVSQLIKGNFKDHFEFLQWFKLLFHTAENTPCSNTAAIVEPATKPEFEHTTKCENIPPIIDHCEDLAKHLWQLQAEAENSRRETEFYANKIAVIQEVCNANKHLPFVQLLMKRMQDEGFEQWVHKREFNDKEQTSMASDSGSDF